MTVDGTMVDVPDTPENVEAFGKYAAGRQPSAFPKVKLVTLVECGTHATVWAEMDAVAVSERPMFSQMSGQLTEGMLVLADRGFYSYHAWVEARHNGAELLWRVSDNIVLTALEYLPDGSFRSELLPAHLKASLKTGRFTGEADEYRIQVRVIEYMITGRGPTSTIRLVTSLMDHTAAPAVELAALYADRWEHELAFDEIKEHQMHPRRVLRSRTPDLVRQEIWAFLITHYAVRNFITEAADDMGEDPDRLSFTEPSTSSAARSSTRRRFLPPSRLNQAHQATVTEIQDRRLPERRHRTSPRVVKRITILNSSVKHAHHVTIKHDGPPGIHVFNTAAA